jgi:hypothetical protein
VSPSALAWGDLRPRVPGEPKPRRIPARRKPRRYEHLVPDLVVVNGATFERDPVSHDLVRTGA